MNTTLKTLGACLALSLAPSAFAASTTDLSVKGLITPSACTPSLSNAGTFDHGKISAKDLNPTTWTSLPSPAALQLSVTCESKTLFSLNTSDNRADSGWGLGQHGLGLVNGKKLGFYNVIYSNVLADGVLPWMLWSMDNEKWNRADDSEALYAFFSFGDRSTWSYTPIPVQNVQMELNIYTAIVRADTLPLNEEITLDGSTTITTFYL